MATKELNVKTDAKGFEYPLTFTEALQALQDKKGWIQGSDFKDGIYLDWDDKDYILMVKDASPMSRHAPWQFTISRNNMSDMYRLVHTGPDACRKVRC